MAQGERGESCRVATDSRKGRPFIDVIFQETMLAAVEASFLCSPRKLFSVSIPFRLRPDWIKWTTKEGSPVALDLANLLDLIPSR